MSPRHPLLIGVVLFCFWVGVDALNAWHVTKWIIYPLAVVLGMSSREAMDFAYFGRKRKP